MQTEMNRIREFHLTDLEKLFECSTNSIVVTQIACKLGFIINILSGKRQMVSSLKQIKITGKSRATHYAEDIN
jgi:hypothetical protein